MSEELQNEWKEAVEINFPVADFPLCSFCHVKEESKSEDQNYWSRKIKENLMLLEAEKPFREEHQVTLTEILERRKHLYFVHVFPLQYKESKIVTDYEQEYVDKDSWQWYCVDLELDRPNEENPGKTRYILGHYKILNKHLFEFDHREVKLGLSMATSQPDKTSVSLSPETIREKQAGLYGPDLIRDLGLQFMETVDELFNNAEQREEETPHYLHLPKCVEDEEEWGFYYSAMVFYLNPLLEKFMGEMGRLPDSMFRIRGSLVKHPDEYFSIIKNRKVFTEEEDVRDIDGYLIIPDSIKIINNNPWKTGIVTFPGAVGLIDESDPSHQKFADLPEKKVLYSKGLIQQSFAENAEGTEIYTSNERGVVFKNNSLSDWLCSYDEVPKIAECVGKGFILGSCSVPLQAYEEAVRFKEKLQREEWNSFQAIEEKHVVQDQDRNYGYLKPEAISHLIAIAPNWAKEQSSQEYKTEVFLTDEDIVFSHGSIKNASRWNQVKISLPESSTVSLNDEYKLAIQYQRPVHIPVRYTGGQSEHPVELDKLTLTIKAEYEEITRDTAAKDFKYATHSPRYERKEITFTCQIKLDASIKDLLHKGEELWLAVYLHGISKWMPKGYYNPFSLVKNDIKFNNALMILQEHFIWGEYSPFNADIGLLSVPYTFSSPHFWQFLPGRGILEDNPVVVRADMKSYNILLQKRALIQSQIKQQEIKSVVDLTLGLLELVPGVGSVAKVLQIGSGMLFNLMGSQTRINIAASFFKLCEVLSGIVVTGMDQSQSKRGNTDYLMELLNERKGLWSEQVMERWKLAEKGLKVSGILTQFIGNVQQLKQLYNILDSLHSFPKGYRDEDFGEDEAINMDTLLMVMMGSMYWDPHTMRWQSSPEGLALPVMLRVRNTSRKFMGKELAPMPLPLSEHFGKILQMDKLGGYMKDYVDSLKELEKDSIKKKIKARYRELDEDTLETISQMLTGQSERFFTLCGDSSCDTILNDWMDICPNSLDHAGWKEEGLLREVGLRIKDYMIYLDADAEDLQIIEKLSSGKLKITKKNRGLIQKIILKYATGELLTFGWGLLENTKDNESDVWVKLNGENMQVLKRYYLIYQKEEKS